VKRAPWLLLLPALLGAGTSEYRFFRAIETEPGFCELELPNEVLEHARSGMPDVRVLTDHGEEVPYAWDSALPAVATEYPLMNVEVVPNVETTAVVDRGDKAALASAVDVVVGEKDFIKPVILEASPDRASWSQIARASIFSVPGGSSMKTVRFAPNDRRYWRFRLDDKNGPPVHPTKVSVLSSVEERARPLLPVTWRPEADADVSVSTFSTTLPGPNLPVVEVRLDVSDAAFARRVRVFEKVWFRDEVTRRLLGEGEIMRTGTGREQLALQIAEPSARSLEVDIERTSGVPLHLTGGSIATRPRSIVFYAQEGSRLDLHYGSSNARPPNYDLAVALSHGRPAKVVTAKLAAEVDTGVAAPAVAPPPRGAPIDVPAWKTKVPITLPAHGPVTYVDLDRAEGTLSDVRIADDAGRAVPYLVESNARHVRHAVDWHNDVTAKATDGHRETVLRISGLDPAKSVEALELEVDSPDYFARDVSVVEEVSDERGRTGERILGSAHWVKTADDPRRPLRIALARPTRSSAAIHIIDDDNAPLVVAAVAADVALRRLDFIFTPGDHLMLLSGNTSVGAPRFDLSLIAEQVLASPAEPAQLGAPQEQTPEAHQTPRWFWVFVLGAALLLALALGRVLRQEPSPPK
jgi:hypothetical protein